MLRHIMDKYVCNENGEIFNVTTGRKLSTFKGKDGYHRVSLFIKGKSKSYTVHRLILSAFTPNPDPNVYTEINHIDGDKDNNSLNNLEWCDRGFNQRHAYKYGLRHSKKGSENGRAKLTEKDVFNIKALLNYLSQREIAEMFGVSKSTISAIKTGTNWSKMKGGSDDKS